MVNNLLGNLDFQYINAYYAREVLPHFEKVDKLLGNLGDAMNTVAMQSWQKWTS